MFNRVKFQVETTFIYLQILIIRSFCKHPKPYILGRTSLQFFLSLDPIYRATDLHIWHQIIAMSEINETTLHRLKQKMSFQGIFGRLA